MQTYQFCVAMNTRIILLYLTGMLMGLVGCSEDKLPAEPDVNYDGAYTFTAQIENMEMATTKVLVNENGTIQWNAGEAVGLYGAQTANAKFSISGTATSSATATFSGTLTEPDTSPRWAYYPYQADAATDASGRSLTLHLPASYDYTGDTYLPMLGHLTAERQMLFKHLTGILRITLRNIPAEAYAMVLRSVGEDALPLTGTASVADVDAEEAVLSITAEAGYEITYQLGTLTAGEDTRTFFIPLPVGDYPELEISARQRDGTELFTRSLGAKSIRRAQILNVPVMNFDTGEAYILQEHTVEITDEMEPFITLSSINQETGVCTLAYAQAPEGGMPGVGDVLLKPGISERFPQGFLGKVTSVEEDNGSYTVTTGPACLNDAFVELVVDEEVDLYPEDMGAETRAIDWDGTFANFSISMDFSQGSGIYAKGAVTFGIKYHVVIDLKNQYLSYTYKSQMGVEGTAGIKGELSGDVRKQELSPGIPLGVVVIGPIPMTPRLVPSVVLRPRGTFNMSCTLGFKHGTESSITYSHGVWEEKQEPISPNSKSPWDITQGDYSIEGAIFTGLSAELNVAPFQLNDFFAVGIEAQVGPELSGKLDMVQLMTAMNKEELLSAASVTNKFILNGSFVADVNILNFEEKASLTFLDVIFGEATLKVIPDVQQPEAKVEEQSEEKAKAEVTTTLSQQLLTKQTTVKMALEDEEGKVVKESQPTEYVGEPEADEIPTQPLDEEFTNLDKDREFTAYPTVESPLLGDEKVELKSKSVTFSTAGGTLREQLIRMYRNTNGPNWKRDDNWCTEKPLTEWYGISQDSYGGYRIQLDNNNLDGYVQLNDTTIREISMYGNQIIWVNVNQCTNLGGLFLADCPLEKLYLAGCKRLESVGFDYRNLHTLDVSESSYARQLDQCNFERLKVLYARNLSDLTDLPFQIIGANSLDTLDLSGCTQLQTINQNRYTIQVNKYVNLSGCRSLLFDDGGNARASTLSWGNIEYLNLSGCENEQNVGNIYVPASIKELYATHSKAIRRLHVEGSWDGRNTLTSLDLSGCSNMRYLYLYSPYLQMLNLSGCVQLDTLISREDQLRTIDMHPFERRLKQLELDTQLTSINLDNCKELQVLSLYAPQIQMINVAACTLLEELSLYMPIPWIDLSQNEKLRRLHIGNTQIKTLDISSCKNTLEEMRCTGNKNLQQVDFQGCIKLESLGCGENALTELTIDQLPALETVSVEDTNLLSLQVSNCPVLQQCYGYTVSKQGTVTLDNCPQLKPEIVTDWLSHTNAHTLIVQNLPRVTEISPELLPFTVKALHVSRCENLRTVNVGGGGFGNPNRGTGRLEQLILEECDGLLELYCGYNNLNTLDVSTCDNLEILWCADNPSLYSIGLMPGPRPFFKEFYCPFTSITQVIPDWFPGPEEEITGLWTYERRYSYRKYVDGTIRAEDKGYGWYYPGEPECGYHRK